MDQDEVVHIPHIILDVQAFFYEVIQPFKIEIRPPLRSVIADRQARFVAVDNCINQPKRVFVFDLRSKLAFQNGSVYMRVIFLDVQFQAIFCVLAIRDGIVPPTINLDDPEDAVGNFDLVPHVAKQRKVDVAISNSFGFGGTNASLVLKKI